MKIDLQTILTGATDCMPIDHTVQMPEWAALFPDAQFLTPMKALGELRSLDFGVARLSLEVTAKLQAPCARCLEGALVPLAVSGSVLVAKEDEEGLREDFQQDVVLLPGYTLEIDELIVQLVQTQMPMRFLCQEECPGLCMGCGALLAKEACRCAASSEQQGHNPFRDLLKDT